VLFACAVVAAQPHPSPLKAYVVNAIDIRQGNLIPRQHVREHGIMALRHHSGVIPPSAKTSILQYFKAQVERLAASIRTKGFNAK
jgi:hypothetical protein